MNYQQYLQTEHWKLTRGAKLQVSPRCEACGAKTELEVHHKVYRPSWFDVKVGDLQTLCHHCHTCHHAVNGSATKRTLLSNLEASARPASPLEWQEPSVLNRKRKLARMYG